MNVSSDLTGKRLRINTFDNQWQWVGAGAGMRTGSGAGVLD